MTKERFKFIPAVYLLLKKDNRILLMRRCNSSYGNGSYSMIAGHLEGDEDLGSALVREAQEEAGIRLDSSSLRLVHVMHTRSEVPGSTDDERVDFYFQTEDYEGDPSIKEPHKCDHMEWFPLDDMPTNLVPRVKAALTMIEQGESYSLLGW